MFAAHRRRVDCFGVAATALVVAASLLCAPPPAPARTQAVGPAGREGAIDLDSALAEASAGDTILISPGLYPGTHRLKPRVSLIGVAGPDSTILDADGERYVLYGRNVTDGTTIAGLTLVNGRRDHPNSGGGGIYLYRSSPTIVNCVFHDHLGYLGPGVYANNGSHAIVAYCVFSNNEGYLGGAIAAYTNCDLLIYNNVIHDNTAVSGGAILAMSSSPMIARNTIVANSAADAAGGAIYLDSSPALIERNVIAVNEGSGAVFCLDADRPPTILGNLLWRNSGSSGLSACPGYIGADGNVETDPGFVDLAGRVLWRVDSPESEEDDAGAVPWSRGGVATVPQSVVDRWREWRAEQGR
jgi:hypothetical protein